MVTDKKVLLLSGEGQTCELVTDYLASNHNLVGVIKEGPMSKKKLFTNRKKQLGFFKVLGQVIFIVGMQPILNFFSTVRKKFIVNKIKEKSSGMKKDFEELQVNTINDDEVLSLYKNLAPDIIIVFGTRIIKKKIFSNFTCPVYNVHVGITPAYRGVHGGYWALVNNDLENFGITVHQIDAGIDTGQVEHQARILPSKKDNFTTYPLLQLLAGLDSLSKVIRGERSDENRVPSESKLYYHPTIFQYLYYLIFKGIK